MAPSLVLRLPRTDVAHELVLVNVNQSGPLPLDLKLVATDGNEPFVTHIQQRAIHHLQTSNSQTSPDDWQQILSILLLQNAAPDSTFGDLEAVASVAEAQLIISIRKKISGITQRLGAITLHLNEEEDIQLFDWTGYAVSRSDALADQLARLQTEVTGQQSRITELTSQLDDLVKAKKTHEDELLKKFAALLNTKKLKIRDQQRLLAHAKVDPSAATQVQRARSANGRKPDPSRSSKRKANDVVSDSDTDDNFEGTRMDEEDGIRREFDEQPSTPDKSEPDETEDDDTDGSGFAPARSQASRNQTGSKGKALATVNPEMATKAPKEVVTVPSVPPPRRELPFAKSNQRANDLPEAKTPAVASNPAPVMDDDDDTDDEL